tara:strand:+ start:266 stop:454 length:189 start_codon:yes stop_codon:yes gene_type:complete
MKFEQAVQKSIKSFLKGDMPEKLTEMSEDGLTYTPDFFDEMQKNYKNTEVVEPKEMEDADDA